MLNRRPGGSAFCWLSLPHLVSNSSDLQLSDFLSSPSYIIVQSPTQSPTQSLEWCVWLSSSGNNCHAVQRSVSSGASVYECIMGFYLVPFRQPNLPTWFLSITDHWDVSLPSGASLWNGMFGRVEGQNTTIFKYFYLKRKSYILLEKTQKQIKTNFFKYYLKRCYHFHFQWPQSNGKVNLLRNLGFSQKNVRKTVMKFFVSKCSLVYETFKWSKQLKFCWY